MFCLSSFLFFISADMFSPVEKSSKAEGNEWDQVWGRFLTASSLMWSLTLPEHKKKPRPPRSQSLLLFFLPLSFSAWSVRYLTISLLCFGVGRRNASRWKEKRVLVGAVALDFKPYKISNAPQSQTSNWHKSLRGRRARWSWAEQISFLVLQASRVSACEFMLVRLHWLKRW